MSLREWVETSLADTNRGTPRFVLAFVIKTLVELFVGLVAVPVAAALVWFTSVGDLAELLGVPAAAGLVYLGAWLGRYAIVRCQYPSPTA